MQKKPHWLFAPIAVVLAAGLSGILSLSLFVLFFIQLRIFSEASDLSVIALIIVITFGFNLASIAWIISKDQLKKPSLRDYVRYSSLLYVSLVAVFCLYPKCKGFIEVDGVSVSNQDCLAGVDGKVTGLLNTALVVLVTPIVLQIGYFLYLRFKQRKK